MAQKGIREYDAKRLMAEHLPQYLEGDFKYDGRCVLVTPDCSLEKQSKKNPWLKKSKLVVKPDQLFGKRGKHGLLLVDVKYDEAKKWISRGVIGLVIILAAYGLANFVIQRLVEATTS